MRSSIEGLNQEIERLVLHPGIAGRANRLDQVSALRFTPEEGRESPLVSGSRSANTLTPVQDQDPETGFFSHLHSHPSDDSPDSLSPSDGTTPEDAPLGQPARSFARIGSAESSPRINKFMAQLPPEGCERVQLSRTADHPSANPSHIIINKPVAGFQLRPSQGSAFRVAASLASALPSENSIECPAGVVTEEVVEGAAAVQKE